MKMRRPHRVPLARQSLTILRELQEITGGGRWLFPSVRSIARPISENTLNAALRRLGYGSEEMCTHGFRGAAATRLNEMGRWNADAIERQLAHQEANAVRRAYTHSAEYWPERVLTDAGFGGLSRWPSRRRQSGAPDKSPRGLINNGAATYWNSGAGRHRQGRLLAPFLICSAARRIGIATRYGRLRTGLPSRPSCGRPRGGPNGCGPSRAG